MTTIQLGRASDATILGGVVLLWNMGSYPVAIIIFIASVLVPLSKLLAIWALCLAARRSSVERQLESTKLYRITEFIGRWSMVDVFGGSIRFALI